jgi:hypothetical protein
LGVPLSPGRVTAAVAAVAAEFGIAALAAFAAVWM